jgi:uncharacterized protein with NRDE domain
MCSIILRIGPDGVLIGANRDEMVARPWQPPAAYWPETPGIVAGRDVLAGGTWLGINAHGVVAAVLNRHGSLGPAAGKRSRGELPLIALREASASAAAEKIAVLDAGAYRSFNLVVADATGAVFLRGLGTGRPEAQNLSEGVWMITSGEPNELALPRIARHLPKFRNAACAAWSALLADNTPPESSALNIPEHKGFGTLSAALIYLPALGAPAFQFAAGPPHLTKFAPVQLAESTQGR